jgi:hypothetical protein
MCCKILCHGTFGFTSHPKEGVLRIFITLKNKFPLLGLNPQRLGPVASTRRRCGFLTSLWHQRQHQWIANTSWPPPPPQEKSSRQVFAKCGEGIVGIILGCSGHVCLEILDDRAAAQQCGRLLGKMSYRVSPQLCPPSSGPSHDVTPGAVSCTYWPPPVQATEETFWMKTLLIWCQDEIWGVLCAVMQILSPNFLFVRISWVVDN